MSEQRPLVWTRAVHVVLVCALLIGGFAAATGPEVRAADNCIMGQQASGAQYLICMPPPQYWNGDLVVFAHGYVSVTEPVGIPLNQLTIPPGDPNGVSIPGLLNTLGYAFAMSSYSVNGLAVKEGIADTIDMVGVFSAIAGEPPNHVYLAGASMGGEIAALVAEQPDSVFDGALAVCGPVGDFQAQLNYWGDTRVLFERFSPGTLPGSPVQIPQNLIRRWDTRYQERVTAALQADPGATSQLLAASGVPVNPLDPASGVAALSGVLWYNVFATNDGVAKLGGQPYDNQDRIYAGSDDDLLLNRTVLRFGADPEAVAEIEAHYQTSGMLQMPLVTLHTLDDPIVPYWHEPAHIEKVAAAGSAPLLTHISSTNYGHCSFAVEEVVAAFTILVWRVTGQQPPLPESVLPDTGSQAAYQELLQVYGEPR